MRLLLFYILLTKTSFLISLKSNAIHVKRRSIDRTTISVLVQHLSKYCKYMHGDSMIIFAMIGTHTVRSNDTYIGSSSDGFFHRLGGYYEDSNN